MPQPKKPELILPLLPGVSFAAVLLCPLGSIFLNNKGQFTLNTATAVLWFLFLMGIITLLWSIVPAMIYAKRYSLRKSFYAFAYSLFSMFCLSWIPLYAMLTLKTNKWLTRR